MGPRTRALHTGHSLSGGPTGTAPPQALGTRTAPPWSRPQAVGPPVAVPLLLHGLQLNVGRPHGRLSRQWNPGPQSGFPPLAPHSAPPPPPPHPRLLQGQVSTRDNVLDLSELLQ